MTSNEIRNAIDYVCEHANGEGRVLVRWGSEEQLASIKTADFVDLVQRGELFDFERELYIGDIWYYVGKDWQCVVGFSSITHIMYQLV